MNDGFRNRQNFRDQRSKRRSGCGCIAPILLTLVVVALIVFFRYQTKSYTNLNAGFKIAQVCAKSTPVSPPQMYIHVILYGTDGSITFDHQYRQVPGEQVQLQGDIIKYWSGLNAVGLQSGYKLTRLQGYYNDPIAERNSRPDPILLNGGDDYLYKTVHGLPSVTPVVAAINDNSLSLIGDGHTYDITVSQDGLSKTQVNGPLACGLKPQQTP